MFNESIIFEICGLLPIRCRLPKRKGEAIVWTSKLYFDLNCMATYVMENKPLIRYLLAVCCFLNRGNLTMEQLLGSTIFHWVMLV